jgi:hypothetical protein
MRILNGYAGLVSAVALWSGSMLGQSRPPANDWLVVPGLITAGTTRSDLQRLFPAGAVHDDDVELDEGLVRPGTFVLKVRRLRNLQSSGHGKMRTRTPRKCFFVSDAGEALAVGRVTVAFM